jgi:kinesin family member 5
LYRGNGVATFIDDKVLEVNGVQADGSLGKVKYAFDGLFNDTNTQKDIFDKAVAPIIQGVFEGFNGTVLAYGQTSSGKTHTMSGPDMFDETNRGVIPRMVTCMFEMIEDSSEEIEFTVKVSMVEIYMEKIRDLIDPTKTNLKVADDPKKGIYI